MAVNDTAPPPPAEEIAERRRPLVDDVPTPAVVIDLDCLERNLQRFQSAVAGRGMAFRPHVKAHKIPDIAARQLALGAVGIAAAKPSEAEVFWQAGCRDIVVAYPVIGADKWARVAAMARTAKVAVNVDSEVGVRGIGAAADRAGVTVGVQMEIDTGLNRSGLDPHDSDALVELGRLANALPALELEGITTHRGMGFPGAEATSTEQAGHDEGTTMVELAGRLRGAGLAISKVTLGSTATGRAAALPGVTEIRAGAYAFNDAAQLAHGSATPGDVALTVLCTVVSARRRGWATVDAGSKTLGPCDENAPIAADRDAAVGRLTEEHGMVRLGPDASVAIGDRLRLIPQHASAAVDLADEVLGIRDGRVERVWSVRARGKRT